MIERVEIVVGQPHFKMRLEDFLLNHFDSLSKMYLRDLVKTAACEVNGRHENIGYKLKPQDFIEITVDRTRGTAMRAEKIDLDIVFEDDDLIIVNKPAGMLVHPSHRENSGTLLNALAHYLNQGFLTQGRKDAKGQSTQEIEGSRLPTPVSRLIRPGLIHRLDKQTSGLIVAAKNPRAHAKLCNHFMKKRVEKRYLALVDGIVEQDEGTINAPIGRDADLKLWMVKQDGKHAESRFWVRERHADTTLLELEPVTGRTNQLRIHCELLGHPIVGDVQRGGREFERLCLHAYKLGFQHPSGTGQVSFESKPLGF
ncbi:MAG TPA: RluA family pseudouridine synthase [Pyrinomonadaceae bacterium]|nr:RluA family pseudouridine synthase [Acidobacteriota bacterium]HQZ96801.1 RluA family pseudouridine synthase [Pyrinomonadaceae bacterium]